MLFAYCSTFPSDILRSLSEHVVSQSVESVLPNLTHHLKLLSLAMRATDIPPTVSDLSHEKWQGLFFCVAGWNDGFLYFLRHVTFMCIAAFQLLAAGRN